MRSGSHYDLMLEAGGALATWRIARLPMEIKPGDSIAAQALPDHRLAYLSYRGPVSGGRGEVMIAAAGTYRLLGRSDQAWDFELRSEKVRGTFQLIRGRGRRWRLWAISPPPPRSAASGRRR